jgi:hypothetical protein
VSYASAGGFAMPCTPFDDYGCVLCQCAEPLCPDCARMMSADPEHPPELAMDERPFAPADAAQ